MEFFNTLDVEVPEHLMNDVLKLGIYCSDKKPSERLTSYTDWNNANKEVKIELSVPGEVITKRGPTPRLTKKLELISLIAYSTKIEIWLVKNLKTEEQEIKSIFYTPFT